MNDPPSVRVVEPAPDGDAIGARVDAYLAHIALERGLSQNSVEAYSVDLADFARFLNDAGRALTGVQGADVTAFMVHLADKGLTSTSRARKLAAVRSFFKFLVQEGHRETNPCEAIEMPRRPRRLPGTLSREEVERLLAQPDGTTPLGLRDKAMMEMLYSCGLRVSEAVELSIEDLDLSNRSVRVLGKGQKERIVPMGRRVCELLGRYLDWARPQIGPFPGTMRVFINGRGRALSRVSAFKIVRRAACLASIARTVSPHTLRHTFASHMVENGADIRFVQELLGHASVATTEIYSHITRDKVFADYRRYHPRA